MANIKSQIKRIKTNDKARLRNKSAVRRFRDAVTAGDNAVITSELRSASQALDVAVAKGVIHKNTAANKKSSMAKSATKAGVR